MWLDNVCGNCCIIVHSGNVTGGYWTGNGGGDDNMRLFWVEETNFGAGLHGLYDEVEETEFIETDDVFLDGGFDFIAFFSLAGLAQVTSIVVPLISASAKL